MDMSPITIEAVIAAPIDKVWECWTSPEHIPHWAFASDDWEAFDAVNDIQVGGKFKTTMAAKDKSAQFDFGGVYTAVNKPTLLEYDMEKGDNEEKPRHVKIVFGETPEGVKIVQTFDPENENPRDFQKAGWQAILDNFKKYAERAS